MDFRMQKYCLFLKYTSGKVKKISFFRCLRYPDALNDG